MSKSKLTALDLFAGSGGLTVGLKQAGYRVLGAVEADPLAAESYRKNHRIPILWVRPIESLSVASVMRELGIRKGQLDLLAGCPPCQGFSTLRTKNRRSVPDPRNDLIFDFQRFVRGLRPRAVMMENVPALAKDQRIRKFCQGLEDIGYRVEYKILDVADFGVPQRRKRTVLLAIRGRTRKIYWPVPNAQRLTVRAAIGRMLDPRNDSDILHDYKPCHADHVRQIISRIPKDGGSRKDLGVESQLDCHKSFSGFHDVYGRMEWESVAPTITSGCINPSKGRFLHPTEDRAITLREAALLQGFPPRYQFSLRRGRYAVAQMIGNALPPAFAKEHARAISSALGATK